MKNNKIIIAILIIIIVILVAIIGIMLNPSSNAHKDSKITITSNETLYEGDNITVELTDLNKTPIQGVVNLTIKDKDGKVIVNESITTAPNGKANLKLDLDAGEYTVNATFSGNDNFTGNNTSKKITIEKVAVPEVNLQSEPISQNSMQEEEVVDNDPLNLPYPIRAEDDRNGIRM